MKNEDTKKSLEVDLQNLCPLKIFTRTVLNISVPPKTEGKQPLNIAAVVDQRVVLPCKVTGIPPPTILWQKGPKVISGNEGNSFARTSNDIRLHEQTHQYETKHTAQES